MAKIDHSISTPIASRRRFSAGLLAIAAGSVITSGVAAGTAASVADLAPTAGPDAYLIALCSNAEAIDARSLALMDLSDDMEVRDPRWSPLVDEARNVFAECRKSMNRAAEIRAVRLDGLQAKASLSLREMGQAEFEDCLECAPSGG